MCAQIVALARVQLVLQRAQALRPAALLDQKHALHEWWVEGEMEWGVEFGWGDEARNNMKLWVMHNE